MEWNVKKNENIKKSCKIFKKLKIKIKQAVAKEIKQKKWKQETKTRGKKNSLQVYGLIWCSKFRPTHDKREGRTKLNREIKIAPMQTITPMWEEHEQGLSHKVLETGNTNTK